MLSKKLIIIIAAVVVVGGGGGGGFFYMKKRKAAAAAAAAAAQNPEKAGAEEEEEEGGGGGHEGAAGPSVLVIKPIVNLQGEGKNAYLKCQVDVVFRDAELGKLAAGENPTFENSMIKSMVLSTLSQITLEEASDPEIREHICSELKDKLNEKFAPKPPKPGEKKKSKVKKPKYPIKEVLVVEWAVAR